MLDTVVFGPAETVANQTLEALKTSGADILVADVLLPGALIAGEYLGIPAEHDQAILSVARIKAHP